MLFADFVWDSLQNIVVWDSVEGEKRKAIAKLIYLRLNNMNESLAAHVMYALGVPEGYSFGIVEGCHTDDWYAVVSNKRAEKMGNGFSLVSPHDYWLRQAKEEIKLLKQAFEVMNTI